MDKTKIVEKVLEELTICYVNRGVAASPALPAVAESLADAIDFRDADQVHKVFRKARDIESIPTQKTLKECWKNLHEEFIKYESSVSADSMIEYKDPRAAWLPNEEKKKLVNYYMMMSNFASARGLDQEYIACHKTVKDDNGVIHWVNPAARAAFDKPNEPVIKALYKKYLRRLPMYQGYPADAKLNLGLIPPSVDEFKWMLSMEASNEG